MRYFLMVLFNCCVLLLYSQTIEIDSLKQILETSISEEERIHVLVELGEKLRIMNTEEALKYSKEAQEIAEKLKDEEGIADALYAQSAVFWSTGKYEQGINHCNKASKIFKTLELLKKEAKALQMKANILSSQGNKNEAMDIYKKVLEMRRKIGDEKGVAGTLDNIGILYMNKGDYEKQMEYTLEALKIFEKIGDKLGVSYALVNMGTALVGVRQYEKSLLYFEKALKLKQEFSDKEGIAIILNNLAGILVYLKQYDKALIRILEAIKVRKELNDNGNLFYSYSTLGAIYDNQQKYEKSIDAYQNALDDISPDTHLKAYIKIKSGLAKSYFNAKQYKASDKIYTDLIEYLEKLDNVETIYNTHLLAAKFYTNISNFKKSSYHFSQANTLLDSIKTNQTQQLTLDLEAQYQTEKKEQEIAYLEKNNALIASQNQRYLIGAIFLTILLLLLGYFYYQIRQTKNQLSLQNATIAQQNTELQALDRTKSRFFANISHELRTPLTMIIGPLENATQKVKNSLVKEDLQLAQSNSQQLLNLVNEIMDLSKLESGKFTLNQNNTAISHLIQCIFGSYDSLARLRGISWNLNNQLNEDLWIKTDIEKLEKILNNLLSNALKYTPTGGQVTLNVQQIGEQIQFEVKDTGKGIHPDDLPKIFSRFYQTERAGDAIQGGTGIGLALAKELSKLFKGKLTARSEWGKGSIFTFVMPFEKGIVQTRLSPIENKSTKPTIPQNYTSQLLENSKPQLLIVEDNPEMANYLNRSLSSDYQCTIAVDGQQALQKVQEQHFDLITSDVMMPNMDGFEFKKKVNAFPRLRQTPFILLTARALEEDKLAGFALGVDDYITKPFSTNELKARIYNLLSNKYEREAFVKENPNPKEAILDNVDTIFIKKAEQIVLDKLSQSKIKVADLAAALHYSPRQINRLVRASTGLTPALFIREIRLQKAWQLLSKKQVATVSEAAYAVGFENMSYFTLKFSERFGRKPSELL